MTQYPIEEIQTIFRAKGIRISVEWLGQCLGYVEKNHDITNATIDALVENIYEIFLDADLYEIGEPSLAVFLESASPEGIIVLQLDEVTNVGANANKEHKQGDDDNNADHGNRFFKMFLTDGTQSIIGLELRRIDSLHSKLPAGIKIAVRNPKVTLGVLLLSPECVVVLGGRVERLVGYQQNDVTSIRIEEDTQDGGELGGGRTAVGDAIGQEVHCMQGGTVDSAPIPLHEVASHAPTRGHAMDVVNKTPTPIHDVYTADIHQHVVKNNRLSLISNISGISDASEATLGGDLSYADVAESQTSSALSNTTKRSQEGYPMHKSNGSNAVPGCDMDELYAMEEEILEESLFEEKKHNKLLDRDEGAKSNIVTAIGSQEHVHVPTSGVVDCIRGSPCTHAQTKAPRSTTAAASVVGNAEAKDVTDLLSHRKVHPNADVLIVKEEVAQLTVPPNPSNTSALLDTTVPLGTCATKDGGDAGGITSAINDASYVNIANHTEVAQQVTPIENGDTSDLLSGASAPVSQTNRIIGKYRLLGVAKSIVRFKVTPEDGYTVCLSFDCSRDVGKIPNDEHSSAWVSCGVLDCVNVSTLLCEDYLKLPSCKYLETFQTIKSKSDRKKFKEQICLQFSTFEGCFWAENREQKHTGNSPDKSGEKSTVQVVLLSRAKHTV